MGNQVAVVAGGALIVMAIGAFISMRTHESALTELRDAGTQTDATLNESRTRIEELDAELAGERRRTRQAETRVKELLAEVKSARRELEAVQAAAEAPEVADAAEAKDWRAVVKNYPAFKPEGMADALADLDWEVVAESMSNMPSLISQLAEHLAEGRPMTELPAETVGSIQRYNGPLVTTALKLSQKGVAGSDVNGAFSHPGFMSNALAATLLALDMPLDDAQTAKLNQLTDDYSARETKRVADYDEDTYIVERLVDESRLKHRYFQEMYALLSTAQHDAVRPESVRGRTQLDIFSESLAWAGKAGPLLFTDRADLTLKVSAWITRRGGIGADNAARTQTLVEAWVNELPDDMLAWEPDGLVKTGMLQVDHVTESATAVLELLRTLDAELDLDAAGRKGLRAVPGSIVFYRNPADGG